MSSYAFAFLVTLCLSCGLMLLFSCVSLVMSCFSCLFGGWPVNSFDFNGQGGLCLCCCVTRLSSHAFPVISCSVVVLRVSSCLAIAWVYSYFVLLLPSHASPVFSGACLGPALFLAGKLVSVCIVISCFTSHLVLPLSSRAPLVIFRFPCFRMLLVSSHGSQRPSHIEIDDSTTELHPVPLCSWSGSVIESPIFMCGWSP